MLKKKYYVPENLLFLQHSIDNLQKALGKQFSRNQIKNFLHQQREYTLFKQPHGNDRERNKYRVFSIDQCWELDLISFPSLAKYNSNYAHALVCIDLFSRFAFVRALRTKRPSEIQTQLRDIFKTSGRKPHSVQHDSGGEFLAFEMKRFLREQNIEQRVARTTLAAKCAYIESFNRTLKQFISRLLQWKMLSHQPNPRRYIDHLPAIVNMYNNNIHSSIGMRPSEVNKTNAASLYHKLYHNNNGVSDDDKQVNKSNLMVGDFVRVLEKRKTFTKATMRAQWSEEIFRIARIIENRP